MAKKKNNRKVKRVSMSDLVERAVSKSWILDVTSMDKPLIVTDAPLKLQKNTSPIPIKNEKSKMVTRTQVEEQRVEVAEKAIASQVRIQAASIVPYRKLEWSLITIAVLRTEDGQFYYDRYFTPSKGPIRANEKEFIDIANKQFNEAVKTTNSNHLISVGTFAFIYKDVDVDHLTEQLIDEMSRQGAFDEERCLKGIQNYIERNMPELYSEVKDTEKFNHVGKLLNLHIDYNRKED